MKIEKKFAQTSILALICLLVVNAQDKEVEDFNCIYTDRYSRQSFDLSALKNEDGDYVLKSNSNPNQLYVFNFCQYTKEPPCGSTNKSIAFRKTVIEGVVKDCQTVSNLSSLAMEADSKTARLGFMDKLAIVVTLTQISDLRCEKGRYSIKFMVACKPWANRVELSDFTLQDDPCSPTIMINHQAGCPVLQTSSSGIWGELEPVKIVRQLQTDKPVVFQFQGMICFIGGFILAYYGKQLSAQLVNIFFSFIFMELTLGYFYEYLELTIGVSILASILVGIAAFYLSQQKFIQNQIFSFGVGVGLTISFFVIFLFNLQSSAIVYPLLLAFSIFGVAAYFKTDEFFIYFSAFVGSFISIQGLSAFGSPLFPSFIESCQQITRGELEFLQTLIVYGIMIFGVFVIGIKNQLKKENFETK